VITSVLGVGDFARLKERTIKVPLYGRMILLISLEDLIVAKEAVGREKDLLAVKELRAIAAMRAKKNQLPTKNFNVRPRAPTRRSISC
jgi:predicted nucleotidyltransferase